MDKVLSIVLGGGKGTRLYPLTKDRAKPAVPFGGRYRIVDIPISNCINSGFNQIYVLTQFNSASLHLHVARTYIFDNFSNGFVELLAAEQTLTHSGWYEARPTRCVRTWCTSGRSARATTSSYRAISCTAWTWPIC